MNWGGHNDHQIWLRIFLLYSKTFSFNQIRSLYKNVYSFFKFCPYGKCCFGFKFNTQYQSGEESKQNKSVSDPWGAGVPLEKCFHSAPLLFTNSGALNPSRSTTGRNVEVLSPQYHIWAFFNHGQGRFFKKIKYIL